VSGPTGESYPFSPQDPPAPRAARSSQGPDRGAVPREPSTFRPSEVPNRTGTKKNRAGTSPGAGTGTDSDPGPGPTWWERILFGRVSSGQLAAFCRQFGAYLNAGVDISKALAGLQQQHARTALGPVIERLRSRVKRGDSFAEAVAREPQAFDQLFIGMIRAAEMRGGIPETLRLLGRHYENRQSLIRQARSAMIYPVIVLFLSACVVAFLSLWLLPMFASMLRDIAGPRGGLPFPSRVLIAFTDFVRAAGWLLIPAVMIGTPFLLLQIYKTRAGKQVMDRILLWIPVFGPLARKIDTTRFARTLSALLNAGVDVGASLDLTADVLRLDPFRSAVRSVKSEVMHGRELSSALAATGRFGHDVIAVVGSGEETGKLPESLDHLADDYEEQVAHMVKNMGQLVQPILMVFLGGVVLFIILAVLLPYISMLTNLAH
jgi:type II secretory pathway component PulF